MSVKRSKNRKKGNKHTLPKERVKGGKKWRGKERRESQERKKAKKRGENIQEKKGYLVDLSCTDFMSGICFLSKYMC